MNRFLSVCLFSMMSFGTSLAQSPTKVDYMTQLKNAPMFSDGSSGNKTLSQLCTLAGGSSGVLAITRHWTAMDTQSVACNLVFTGGSFQPASGKKVTVSGNVSGPLSQIFDYSLGGTVYLSGPPNQTPVEWWGCVGDWNGTTGTDNTTCLNNAAIGIKVTHVSGEDRNTSLAVRQLLLGPRSYMWTGTLNLDNFQYFQLAGAGFNNSFLVHNPSAPNTDGITWTGASGYFFGNGISGLTITTVSANTRYLVSVTNMAHFLIRDSFFSTHGGATAVNLLRMVGMESTNIEDTQFWCFGTDTDNIYIGQSGNVSTTVNFSGVQIEQSNGAGLFADGASSVTLAHSIIEANKYQIHLSHGALVQSSDSHYEAVASTINTVYADGVGGQSYFLSTNDVILQQASGAGRVYFALTANNFDGVNMHTDADPTMGHAFTTDSASFVCPAGLIVPGGGGNLNLGAGNFCGSKQIPDFLFPAGTQSSGTWLVQGHHGNFQTATITVDTTIDLEATTDAWAAGARITLKVLQDGPGSHKILGFTSGGTAYPVIAAISNDNNTSNAFTMLTFTFDGTSFLQTAYTPWTTLSSGFYNNLTLTGTFNAQSSSTTFGAAADPSIGLKYGGSPPLLNFVSGASTDWVGTFFNPHRAGTTGLAVGGVFRVTADSGTQTSAEALLVLLCSGTCTNQALIHTGANTVPGRSYGFWDQAPAGYPWVKDNWPTVCTGLPTGAVWEDTSDLNRLKVCP